jgi:hypothetical protein
VSAATGQCLVLTLWPEKNGVFSGLSYIVMLRACPGLDPGCFSGRSSEKPRSTQRGAVGDLWIIPRGSARFATSQLEAPLPLCNMPSEIGCPNDCATFPRRRIRTIMPISGRPCQRSWVRRDSQRPEQKARWAPRRAFSLPAGAVGFGDRRLDDLDRWIGQRLDMGVIIVRAPGSRHSRAVRSSRTAARALTNG